MEQESSTSTRSGGAGSSPTGSREHTEQTPLEFRDLGAWRGLGVTRVLTACCSCQGTHPFDRPAANTRCFSGSCRDVTATGSLRFLPAWPRGSPD